MTSTTTNAMAQEVVDLVSSCLWVISISTFRTFSSATASSMTSSRTLSAMDSEVRPDLSTL